MLVIMCTLIRYSFWKTSKFGTMLWHVAYKISFNQSIFSAWLRSVKIAKVNYCKNVASYPILTRYGTWLLYQIWIIFSYLCVRCHKNTQQLWHIRHKYPMLALRQSTFYVHTASMIDGRSLYPTQTKSTDSSMIYHYKHTTFMK